MEFYQKFVSFNKQIQLLLKIELLVLLLILTKYSGLKSLNFWRRYMERKWKLCKLERIIEKQRDKLLKLKM